MCSNRPIDCPTDLLQGVVYTATATTTCCCRCSPSPSAANLSHSTALVSQSLVLTRLCGFDRNPKSTVKIHRSGSRYITLSRRRPTMHHENRAFVQKGKPSPILPAGSSTVMVHFSDLLRLATNVSFVQNSAGTWAMDCGSVLRSHAPSTNLRKT